MNDEGKRTFEWMNDVWRREGGRGEQQHEGEAVFEGSESDITSRLFNLLANVDGAKDESASQSRPAGHKQSVRINANMLPVALSRQKHQTHMW